MAIEREREPIVSIAELDAWLKDLDEARARADFIPRLAKSYRALVKQIQATELELPTLVTPKKRSRKK